MRTNRKWIALAFAIATFAALRITMGPRTHVHHGCHAHCERAAEAPAQ